MSIKVGWKALVYRFIIFSIGECKLSSLILEIIHKVTSPTSKKIEKLRVSLAGSQIVSRNLRYGEKKKKKQPQEISAPAYLKSGRARKLPLHECYISVNWRDTGLATIIVSRKHVNKNVTFACFLVDVYCLGVKDAWFNFNMPSLRYLEFLEKFASGTKLKKTDYVHVHNVIYGAIAFAEDYGFSPHNNFKLARMVLEEDSEEVPLIEYEFGLEGKPHLVVNYGEPKLPFYQHNLDKYAGKGNYHLSIMDFEGDDDETVPEYDEEEYFSAPEEWEQEEWENFIVETDLDHLDFLRSECLHIFEKAIFEPTMASKMQETGGKVKLSNIQITREPLDNHDSAEEIEEGQQIYETMQSEDNSIAALHRLLDRVKSAMRRWPQNPMFQNYLINAYRLLGEEQKEKKAVLSLKEQFPDYLFGKVTYAHLLIAEGNLDAVPEVFNNHFDLKLICPERKLFHLSEVSSFNAVMCLYFLARNDLSLAYVYKKALKDLSFQEALPHIQEIFFRVDISITKQVRKMLIEAKHDINKRKELIENLISEKLAKSW